MTRWHQENARATYKRRAEAPSNQARGIEQLPPSQLVSSPGSMASPASASSSSSDTDKKSSSKRPHVKRLSDAVQGSMGLHRHRKDSEGSSSGPAPASGASEVMRLGLASLNEQLCTAMLGVVLSEGSSREAGGGGGVRTWQCQGSARLFGALVLLEKGRSTCCSVRPGGETF